MQQRQANKIDSGRSMVEMLGVMAIMGMLSVVVIFGIRLGLDKAKANQIIKDARLAHTSLLTDPMSDETEWLGSGFNPTSGKVIRKRINHDKQIEVVVMDVEPKICQELLKFTSSGKVKFYDGNNNDLLVNCGEENSNIKIMFDMAADEELDHSCVNKDDCDNGLCEDGVCVPCPDGETPNEAGDACTIFCNEDQETCFDDEDEHSWCCPIGQCTPEFPKCTVTDGKCSWEYEQGDLTATCSWEFVETPAQSTCSMTYTQDARQANCSMTYTQGPRLASCTVSFGEAPNTHKTTSNYSSGGTEGSLSLSRMDQDCPAGSYCYVQFNDEHCDSNAQDASIGTLYGVCNPLSAAQNICTRKANPGESTGCDQGQYCYLQFTDDDCDPEQHALPDNFIGTLYGVCNSLGAAQDICSRQTHPGIPQGCEENQYCVLSYLDTACSSPISDDSIGTLYGVCQPFGVNESRCVKGVELNPTEKSGCPQGQYCILNYTQKTCGDDVVTDTSHGELWGTCVAFSSNESRCVRPFTMTPNSYCPQNPQNQQNQYCFLNWETSTDCSTADNNHTGLIYGTCLDLNKNSGACPYEE